MVTENTKEESWSLTCLLESQTSQQQTKQARDSDSKNAMRLFKTLNFSMFVILLFCFPRGI